jgi:hypothetical protein
MIVPRCRAGAFEQDVFPQFKHRKYWRGKMHQELKTQISL